ncbi:hypothetical protein C41B8_18387 [Salinisphaera hydrothermalis C41B8]|uniref:Uncharacterized protein n=1 Tax=Salinisphaera hydrothermalis (strain C41B8) TaxID=1304275 RepID=A0A084IGB4_SALHC|nr:hypothetical protein C41B8_18387 [Salinisphaera hydrothermalis C41B8]
MGLLRFALLVQGAPGLILGLDWTRMNATAVFVGMLTGAVIAATLTLADLQPLGLFHGLWGCSRIWRSSAPTQCSRARRWRGPNWPIG